jgi:uncharacterized membrane protein
MWQNPEVRPSQHLFVHRTFWVVFRYKDNSENLEICMANRGGPGARIGEHPIHPMLVPFPIAFLVGALACDIAFWSTRIPFWATAAIWLIGAALVMAALAAIAGLIDFASQDAIRMIPAAGHHMIGNVVAVVLSLLNFWLRYDEGAINAVVPWGLTLSVVVAGILLYTGWLGGELVFRHQCGMIEETKSRRRA